MSYQQKGERIIKWWVITYQLSHVLIIKWWSIVEKQRNGFMQGLQCS